MAVMKPELPESVVMGKSIPTVMNNVTGQHLLLLLQPVQQDKQGVVQVAVRFSVPAAARLARQNVELPVVPATKFVKLAYVLHPKAPHVRVESQIRSLGKWYLYAASGLIQDRAGERRTMV